MAVLFDLDGVIYEGETLIPGAAETVAWCRRENIPHLFLTNTTSRPGSVIASRLTALGIPVDPAHILTPTSAAAAALRKRQCGPVALFAAETLLDEFTGLALLDRSAESGAGAVVVGDLGEEWDFHRLNQAFRLLIDHPSPVLIALGLTRYWKAPEGLRLDVGPFIKALEYATGVTAEVFGKPSPAYFKQALSLLAVDAKDALMIGDDILGDIGGARSVGIGGILVQTGKYRPMDLAEPVQPEAILPSIAEFPRWYETHR